MTSSKNDESRLQIAFRGGIIDLDKSEIPAKLTAEQSRQLAEVIYLSFKSWFGR